LPYNPQTPGNNPKESIRHSKQGESLKSRKLIFALRDFTNAPKNARTEKKLEQWGLKPCLLPRETVWVKTN
jgi:hypothetical protein